MIIWVNEQIDSCGIVYSCIATCDEKAARECHQSWQDSLSEQQKKEGWIVSLRKVHSWEEVPITALKLR